MVVLTLMDVLEEILENVRAARDLEVDVALKFAEQCETVWDHHLVANLTASVMNTSLDVNRCCRL
jgi:hypothetical protein